MKQKTIVFVLGVGRSGSSAMTGVLSLCGAALPKPLLGANAGNPKGHFEPVEALSINDAYLAQNASAFYDPSLRLQDGRLIDESERDRFVEQIAALIGTWPDEDVLVVKDPRITALADYWFEAARRKGYSAKVIIMVRRPEEVVASFATRDHLSKSLSGSLWLKYNLLAEHASNSKPRVFVEYSNLLNNWRTEISRISEALSISLFPPEGNEIDDFLTQDLHRQRYDAHPIDSKDPWTQHVYESFLQASQGKELDVEDINNVFSEYAACEKMFRESWTEFGERFAPRTVPPSTHANWENSEYRSHPDIPGDFDAHAYLAVHVDVAKAGVDPYRHYVEFGKKEGRLWTRQSTKQQDTQPLLDPGLVEAAKGPDLFPHMKIKQNSPGTTGCSGGICGLSAGPWTSGY